jgi:arylsulfatase A-like enzyme
LGIADNTIIIFSSDNGAHAEGGADPKYFNSTGGLRGIKRDLYEGGIRIPMIVKWPGKIEAGRVSKHISAFWDLLPTVADIVGVSAPDSIDGISFLPELLGQEQQKHSLLYWEFYEKNGRQAVRKGPWKAVRYEVAKNYEGTSVELYNLDEDPYEKTNVAEQYPDVAAEMLTLIKKCHTPSENFIFEMKNKKNNPVVRKK